MSAPRLISNLRRFSGKEEAAASLGFVGDLLSRLDLKGDDRRFHFNPTTGSQYSLPLTVNNRSMLMKGRDVEGGPTWWLIHPGPHAVTEAETMRSSLSFAHKRHDAPELAPMLVQFPFSSCGRTWKT